MIKILIKGIRKRIKKRNHDNKVICISNINNKNGQKKSERQNSYNNHKLYTSHYKRRNQKDSNTNLNSNSPIYIYMI